MTRDIGQRYARDMGFVDRKKLTKGFLMDQPVGSYIVSNCYRRVSSSRYEPVFQEEVKKPEEREAQWERIKAARANGRLCFVYPSIEDYAKSKSVR